jgi:hypothetical protein
MNRRKFLSALALTPLVGRFVSAQNAAVPAPLPPRVVAPATGDARLLGEVMAQRGSSFIALELTRWYVNALSAARARVYDPQFKDGCKFSEDVRRHHRMLGGHMTMVQVRSEIEAMAADATRDGIVRYVDLPRLDSLRACERMSNKMLGVASRLAIDYSIAHDAMIYRFEVAGFRG